MFTFRPGRNGAKNSRPDSGRQDLAGRNGTGSRTDPASSPSGPIDSVIGPGLQWKGALTGSGGLRVDGSVDGDININGPLVVAEGGKVTAEEVRATAVLVAGTIKANIMADRVEILATGRVYGDLVTQAFASEDGAFLRGQVIMQDHLASAGPGEPETP